MEKVIDTHLNAFLKKLETYYIDLIKEGNEYKILRELIFEAYINFSKGEYSILRPAIEIEQLIIDDNFKRKKYKVKQEEILVLTATSIERIWREMNGIEVVGTPIFIPKVLYNAFSGVQINNYHFTDGWLSMDCNFLKKIPISHLSLLIFGSIESFERHNYV